MNLNKLIMSNLKYYWRNHLGVFLGAAIATAILLGALIIGDSVRYSLNWMGQVRLGQTHVALSSRDRFVQFDLAQRLAESLNTTAASILQLNGMLTNSDDSQRAYNVSILAVDDQFWSMATTPPSFTQPAPEEVILNQASAQKLGVTVGDEIVIRTAKPSLLPQEAPLSNIDNAFVTRLTVKAIAPDDQFGRFSLQANQISPLNAFVDHAWFSRQVELPDTANTILIAQNESQSITVDSANTALSNSFTLADANLQWLPINDLNQLELRTNRVFIEESIANAIINAPQQQPTELLTYFVNAITRIDEEVLINESTRSTPYSMITAIRPDQSMGILPDDMKENEIIVNQWLANDLDIHKGSKLEIKYYVMGPMRTIKEKATMFTVRDVIPIEGLAADQNLMPAFSGIEQADNCRDWSPGVPINLDEIDDNDEQYWDDYRGTPKAFITLSTGQHLWQNDYGQYTAFRFPETPDIQQTLAKEITAKINPEKLGLFFMPVATSAQAASSNAMDFGQLFLSLSFFIIVSAMILTGLLFSLGIEQRQSEAGLFKALGFTTKQIRLYRLREAGLIALFAAVPGTILGITYTYIVIHALTTVWKDAIGSSVIIYHASIGTYLTGIISGIAMAFLSIYFAANRQAKTKTTALLSGRSDLTTPVSAKTPRTAKLIRIHLLAALAAFILAVIIIGLAFIGNTVSTGAFFGAGSLMLIGFLILTRAAFTHCSARSITAKFTIQYLALQNMLRNQRRSLAVIILLACGVFIVFAVGANKNNPLTNAQQRSAGTGGFALFAESAIPVVQDLNNPKVQEEYGIEWPFSSDQIKIVPMKLREGDDASCLNLNRSQHPQIIGVAPSEFASRNAFSFTHTIDPPKNTSIQNPWELLNTDFGEDIVPAITDQAAITWALGKALGDTIDYTDDSGQTLKVLLVGGLKNSLLQGKLIIAEKHFKQRFPSCQGYRQFLIDAPFDQTELVSLTLETRLRNQGFNVHSSIERLASFYAMQNTYLSIFQLLGVFGIILGTVGLGLVVLRNIIERRHEFAMMRSVGFQQSQLQKLVLSEHLLLLLAGFFFGAFSALVALWPSMRFGGIPIPWPHLTITLVIILGTGILWITIAAHMALRGQLIDALRNE